MAALSQSLRGYDQYQDAGWLEPTIRVAQEHLLGAATVTWPQCIVVRRIQKLEPEAFDGALHFQRIALNDVLNPLFGLLGAVCIKLDTVAKHFSAAGDDLERRAIANTRVERGRGFIGKQEKSANPLRFGKWQRVESETTFALEAQFGPPFFEELGQLSW
jgi:hypothetical protein